MQNMWMNNVNIDMNSRTISGDVDLMQVTELQITDADWSFKRENDPTAYALELAEYIRLRLIYGGIIFDYSSLQGHADLSSWVQKKAYEAYPGRGISKITSVKFYPKGGYSILVEFFM